MGSEVGVASGQLCRALESELGARWSDMGFRLPEQSVRPQPILLSFLFPCPALLWAEGTQGLDWIRHCAIPGKALCPLASPPEVCRVPLGTVRDS